MKKSPRRLVLVLIALGLVSCGAAPAMAYKTFREQFKIKYIKAESQDPHDAALREAFDKAGCAVCHVGKSKEHRNAYGQALGRALGHGEAKKDPAKIQAALEKAAAAKSNPKDPHSPTFGQLIGQGKLPGGAK